MKNSILIIFLILFSCAENQEKKRIAEISCGQCQFGLTSKKGCDLAVKIDDKAYFVEGAHIDDFGDAHDKNTGFCEVVRKANITGKIKDNQFYASEIKLIE